MTRRAARAGRGIAAASLAALGLTLPASTLAAPFLRFVKPKAVQPGVHLSSLRVYAHRSSDKEFARKLESAMRHYLKLPPT